MEFGATIRNGRVTLAPSDNVMVEGGALAVLARAATAAEVSIADVSWEEDDEADEREVRVYFLANENVFARRALKRWARSVGHFRVWFRDELFEASDLPPARPEAVTGCRTCGLEMRDGSDAFWDMVTDCGFFPPYCFTCGATVPQWTTEVPVRGSRRARRLRHIRLHSEAEGVTSELGSEPDDQT